MSTPMSYMMGLLGVGNQQQSQSNALGSAANAMASGTAGTAGTAAQNASTPTWMQGLLGAMTGNQAYGKSAPAVHQLMQAGMQMMQAGQGQPPPQRPMQRPMQQGAPIPYPGAPGMMPPGASPMPNPMGGASPAMPGQQPGQPNPWLHGLPPNASPWSSGGTSLAPWMMNGPPMPGNW
jgi:hypothetical protein